MKGNSQNKKVSLVRFTNDKKRFFIQTNEVKNSIIIHNSLVVCWLVKLKFQSSLPMMAPPTDSSGNPRHLAFWPHPYHATDALHNDASDVTKSPQSIASFETSVSLESSSIILLPLPDHRILPRLRLQPRHSLKNDAADVQFHLNGMGLKKENQATQSQILFDAKATTRYSLHLEPMPRRIFLPDI
jgi:hypothetical protein